LNDQTVYQSNNYLICGNGFNASRKVKILSKSSISLTQSFWNTFSSNNYNINDNNTALIYIIDRPFSDLFKPNDADEIGSNIIQKFVANLRSISSVDTVFQALTESLKELKLNYLNNSSESLSSALKKRWSDCTERICQVGGRFLHSPNFNTKKF
jgi:hypothetical protein